MKLKILYKHKLSNDSHCSSGSNNYQVSTFKRKRIKNLIKSKYLKLFQPYEGKIEIISYWDPDDATIQVTSPEGCFSHADDTFSAFGNNGSVVAYNDEDSSTSTDILSCFDISGASSNCSEYSIHEPSIIDFVKCSNNISARAIDAAHYSIEDHYSFTIGSTLDCEQTVSHGRISKSLRLLRKSDFVRDQTSVPGACVSKKSEQFSDSVYTVDVSSPSAKVDGSFTIDASSSYGSHDEEEDSYISKNHIVGPDALKYEQTVFHSGIFQSVSDDIAVTEIDSEPIIVPSCSISKVQDSFTIETSSFYGSHDEEEIYFVDSTDDIVCTDNGAVYEQSNFHSRIFQSNDSAGLVKYLSSHSLSKYDLTHDSFDSPSFFGSVSDNVEAFHADINYRIFLLEGVPIHNYNNESTPASFPKDELADVYSPLATSDGFGGSIIPYEFIPQCIRETRKNYFDSEKSALRDDKFYEDNSPVSCGMSSDVVTVDFRDHSNNPSLHSSRLASMESKAWDDTYSDAILNKSEHSVVLDVSIDKAFTSEDGYNGLSSAEPKSATFDRCDSISSIESPVSVPRNDAEIAKILSNIQALDEMLFSLGTKLNRGLEKSERESVLEMIELHESSLSDLQADLRSLK